MILSPIFWLYLWRRGRKEPAYRLHWKERLGWIVPQVHRPFWVHGASVGELRAAYPLIKHLVEQGFALVVTTWTPSGRAVMWDSFQSQRHAASTPNHLLIQTAQHGNIPIQIAYVPAEWSGAVKRWIRRMRPQGLMVLESDVWPGLLHQTHRLGVPICKANAGYPRTSFERDQRWWGLRSDWYQAYALVMCKSTEQAHHFEQVGCQSVQVCGELRFETPIAPALLHAASACLPLLKGRKVVALVSMVAQEEALLSPVMQHIKMTLGDQAPLFVWIPRSPSRFVEIAPYFEQQGFRVVKRSQLWDNQWQPLSLPLSLHHDFSWETVDILIGDSLGEMFFYLALAQAVVVGGSWVDLGSHNVIEPLALQKPTWVGASIWGIMYPAVEAMAHGVLFQALTPDDLKQDLIAWLSSPPPPTFTQAVQTFFEAHGQATQRHWLALSPWMQAHRIKPYKSE